MRIPAGKKGADRSYVKPRKAGQPTKLSPELAEEIIKYLANGCYLETAAAAAGIHKETLQRWLRLGKERPGSDFAKFRLAVEQARASAEMNCLNALEKHFGKNWQAIAWRMSRAYPERWGAAHRGLVTQQGDGEDDDFRLNYSLNDDEGKP